MMGKSGVEYKLCSGLCSGIRSVPHSEHQGGSDHTAQNRKEEGFTWGKSYASIDAIQGF